MTPAQLQKEIEAARKSVAKWPKWMREAAYFACTSVAKHPYCCGNYDPGPHQGTRCEDCPHR